MPERDAPKLGRPKLPEREGLTRAPPTPERPKLPPLDAPLLERPTLGRLVLVRGAVLVRLGTELARPSEPLEDGVVGRRPTLAVRTGFVRGRLTTVVPGRGEGAVRTTPVAVRPRLMVSTRLALGGVRLTPVVRVLGTRPTTEVRVGVLGTRPTVDVRVGARVTVPVGRDTTVRRVVGLGAARTVVGRRATLRCTGTGWPVR